MSQLSLELYEKSKKVSPGGVHSPVRAFKNVDTHPRFIKKGAGTKIWDVDDQCYTDYCMSWGPLILGHADEDVAAAVQASIANGWTFGTAETHSLELAEFMVDSLPCVEKVRFVNSGTEAVMTALRLARAVTRRDKIIKFDGCYHGHVDSMLVAAGSGLAEMATPDSAGVTQSTAADTVVVPLDDLAALEAAFDLHKDQIAAIIVEPVPANNGLLLQKDGFLAAVKKIAEKNGALTIFDEVITGFRVAFGGMAEKSGVQPDIVTYGKVIGGGFPVGAFGASAEIMDHIAPLGNVYQAGTLSANPVAMVAGLTTLKKLKTTNPYARLAELTSKMGQNLTEKLSGQVDVPVTVQSYASLFWMAIGKRAEKSALIRRADMIPDEQKAIYSKLYPHLLSEGFYLAPSGFEVGFMSTVHTEQDNDALCEAILRGFQKIQS